MTTTLADGAKVNGAAIKAATIKAADILASNAVIHVIGSVILPPI